MSGAFLCELSHWDPEVGRFIGRDGKKQEGTWLCVEAGGHGSGRSGALLSIDLV